MTMIRVTGSQLHAARVLAGLSRENLAERAGLCRHSIRKWEMSSHAIPAAMYAHLCRVVDILEGEGTRFTGDGVSTLSGDSPLSNGSGTPRHQLRMIARVYISVWIWLLGSVTPAYATRA
jgi:transcriptional regulator with XRE-family HTH domain